jgi:hypothetical protein
MQLSPDDRELLKECRIKNDFEDFECVYYDEIADIDWKSVKAALDDARCRRLLNKIRFKDKE